MPRLSVNYNMHCKCTTRKEFKGKYTSAHHVHSAVCIYVGRIDKSIKRGGRLQKGKCIVYTCSRVTTAAVVGWKMSVKIKIKINPN